VTCVTDRRQLPGGASGHSLAVCTLPKRLDEKVAARRLGKIGAKLTKLTHEQSNYLGVPQTGPFKSEQYRY